MHRLFRALLAFTTLMLSASSWASPAWTPYSPTVFVAAQAAGRAIVVDVAADWCPTCRAQLPTLDELRADENMKDVLFFRVDFDEDKHFLDAHRVRRQSTILVFDGEKELARSIAETDRDRLRRVVLDALANK